MPKVEGTTVTTASTGREPVAPPRGRVANLVARLEVKAPAIQGEGLEKHKVTNLPAHPDVAARTNLAFRALAATPEEIAEFNELLNTFADQIGDPNFSLRKIPNRTLDRLNTLDIKVPRDPGRESIRQILSFFLAPQKITAQVATAGHPLDPTEALAGLLAITRAAGAEKDNLILQGLARGFRDIRAEVLKMPGGEVLARQMVATVFERAHEAPYQRFLMDYVVPELGQSP